MVTHRKRRRRAYTNYPLFHYKRWTPLEDLLLVHLLAHGLSNPRISMILSRSGNSIIYRANRNVGPSHSSTQARDNAIKKLESGAYPLVTLRNKRLIALALNGISIRKWIEDDELQVLIPTKDEPSRGIIPIDFTSKCFVPPVPAVEDNPFIRIIDPMVRKP